MRDLEKLERKLIIKKISPKDIFVIYNIFEKVKEIYNFCSSEDEIIEYLNKQEVIEVDEGISEVLEFLNKFFDIDKLKNIDNLNNSKDIENGDLFFLKSGNFKDVDKFILISLENDKILELIAEFFFIFN